MDLAVTLGSASSAANDVTVTAEASTTLELNSWSPLGITSQLVGTRLTFSLPPAAGDQPQRFIRLKATHPALP
jgi:hypothetical protein